MKNTFFAIKMLALMMPISLACGWIGNVLGGLIVLRDSPIIDIITNPFFFLLELPGILAFPFVYFLLLNWFIKKGGDPGPGFFVISGLLGSLMIALNPLTLIIFPIAFIFLPVGFVPGLIFGLLVYLCGIQSRISIKEKKHLESLMVHKITKNSSE